MKRIFIWGIILISAFMASSCDKPKMRYHDSDPIVGGQPFGPGDSLPKHVVLLKTSSRERPGHVLEEFSCSGVLVLNQYVLTAAHCIKLEKDSDLEVIFPLSKSKEKIHVEHAAVHPEYTPEDLGRQYSHLRDIALIRLRHLPPKPYTSINLIQLNLMETLDFRAVGFGQQNGMILKHVGRTFELRYAELHTDNYDTSLPYFDVLQKKGGACFGDSGGPAVVSINDENYLIGIAVDVLFNPARVFEPQYDRCLEKAVYLNVPYFREWIMSAVQSLR